MFGFVKIKDCQLNFIILKECFWMRFHFFQISLYTKGLKITQDKQILISKCITLFKKKKENGMCRML